MTGPRSTARMAGSVRTFDAFRNPGFRLFWPANFFANLSRRTQMTLLPWMVLVLTGSPFRVALVGFFAMLPMLLLGIVGGMLADRVNRRALLMSTQSANVVVSVTMTVLLYLGAAQYWHAYLAVLLVGTGGHGSMRTPGLRMPFGSSRFFTARIDSANSSGRSTS